MKTVSAHQMKNAFGLMIDIARAAPALIEKYECGVMVVAAVEEYERLTGKPGADLRMVRNEKKN